MNVKKIAILIFLVGSLTAGSVSFLTISEVDPVPPPDLEPKVNETLTIVTRHDVTLTNAFTSAFLATPEAISLGVTSLDIRQATTDAGWKTLLETEAIGVDIAWGGGPALFNTVNKWGLLKHIDVTQDPDLFYAINNSVPHELAGSEMKSFAANGSFIWAANAISSFGFTVNHDFLDTYGLPIPTTWLDLASPTYYMNPSIKAISMGDPPLTTSNTRIYHIILQAFGWDEGWSILTRIAGNSGIYPGSVDTRAAVVSGEVGIGMTIDFYGVIANRENPNCEYIIPQGQSIVNGDPIAMGINVDDYEAAKAFLKYVNTPEGQAVWLTMNVDRLPVNVLAFDTPFGQDKDELEALYYETLDNIGIDFNETLATEYLDTTIYYFHNTITQRHTLLRNTWGAMVEQLRDETINATYFEELVDRLGETNMTEAEALAWNTQYQDNFTFAANKDSEWRTFSAAKYNEIYNEIVTNKGSAASIITSIISTVFLAVLVIRRRRK